MTTSIPTTSTTTATRAEHNYSIAALVTDTSNVIDPTTDTLSHTFLYSDINELRQRDNILLQPCLAPVLRASLGHVLSLPSSHEISEYSLSNMSSSGYHHTDSTNNNNNDDNNNNTLANNQQPLQPPLSSLRFPLIIPHSAVTMPTTTNRYQTNDVRSPDNTHLLVLQIEDAFDTLQSAKSRVGVIIDPHSSSAVNTGRSHNCESVTNHNSSSVNNNGNNNNNSNSNNSNVDTFPAPNISSSSSLFNHSRSQRTGTSTTHPSVSRLTKLRATDGFTNVILIESEAINKLNMVKAGSKIILDIRYLFGRCYGLHSSSSLPISNHDIDVLLSSCVIGLTERSVLFVGGYVPSMALQHEREKVQVARAFSGRPQPISSQYDPGVASTTDQVVIQSVIIQNTSTNSTNSPMQIGERSPFNSNVGMASSRQQQSPGSTAVVGTVTSVGQQQHSMLSFSSSPPFTPRTTFQSNNNNNNSDNKVTTSISDDPELREDTRHGLTSAASQYKELSLAAGAHTTTIPQGLNHDVKAVPFVDVRHDDTYTCVKCCTVVNILGVIQVVCPRSATVIDATGMDNRMKFRLLAELREVDLFQGASPETTIVVNLGHDFISHVLLNGMNCEDFISVMLTEAAYGSSTFIPSVSPPMSFQHLQHDIRSTSQQLLGLPAMYFRLKEYCRSTVVMDGKMDIREEEQLIYPKREAEWNSDQSNIIPLYLVVEVLPEI